MSDWRLLPVEITDEIRNAAYMALHYDMSVINPDEWGAVDKAYAAIIGAAPGNNKKEAEFIDSLIVEGDRQNQELKSLLSSMLRLVKNEDRVLATRVERAIAMLNGDYLNQELGK